MRLTIENIGIVGSADLELKKTNVIIGPQSLGKSTILKICSYCNWVEKRIQLSHDPEYFAEGNNFISRLVEFHKLYGYFNDKSYIRFGSETMEFWYSYGTNTFEFRWKEGKEWDYRRSKIFYVPSERNLVGAIPNWYEVKLDNNNIRNFMIDWETARKAIRDLPILNLGLSYHYDKVSNGDKIRIKGRSILDFTNSSSGLQSIVPMFLVLSYAFNSVAKNDIKGFIDEEYKNDDLKGRGNVLDNNAMSQLKLLIYKEVFENRGKGRTDYYKILWNYLENHYCKIFLEEPENNLFPPTQDRFISWLISKNNENQDDFLFVATHSPYVLNSFLERKEDSGLFVVFQAQDGMSYVRSLTDREQGEIYDNGIDAFFNLENLVSE